ncbi:cell envelope integrity protein TolA [Legionella taurinensis]|uniref:Cell envelope integrity protein TolA n=1 Tax=Legionella taurinensis TaxID=70611 RepID=A0AB38N663_9GAMM|nr:cell envelope integrity protein TolA [Legionella taurinensis]MDX1838226.1 cell envelope integrity protein TolA [Legionella taurinensis]PUT39281.1 cell envelope integrity protein TolA [Legionella taurinensis]PUT40627.1 cell envelope integrity protein TolA [Legionella taurinensis]PUT44047.1 cell envelope integrity protein TolA [Legionella taurinensis]PUT46309.1 cell envelope integrity protein TolA [Legionella taurinensis]
MRIEQSYRKAFYAALTLHLLLALLLLTESSSKRPVLVNEAKNTPGEMTPIEANAPQKEIVKAVSVNNQEVMETVNRIKEQRAQQIRAEQARQKALAQQAEQAKRARLQEQQRLAKLKEEADKLAIARKKQMEEEQKRLKQLALQKEQEAKRLEELKKKQKELQKQQQEEAAKLAQLQKKKDEEKAKADKLKADQAAAEARKKEEAVKVAAQKAAAEKAAADAAQAAANRARLAGEVDKYKALIINAIGRQWILPDNVDRGLSSQFRIRLAPDGAVLEVSLIRSSGDPILDRSAQTAIYKASPLPVPTDPATFDIFRDISLTVRPENVRG